MEEHADTLPELTGNPRKDMSAFRKSKSYAFGISMLKYYAPRNRKLIRFFEENEETPARFDRMMLNLKIITSNAKKN